MELVPLAEGFIGENERVFARRPGTVVPESATSKIGIQFEFARIGVVPDLNLWITLEVDTAVCSRYGLILEHQFIIGVILVRDEVRTLAVVYEFTVFDCPMLFRILHPFGHLLLSGRVFHLRQLDRAEVRSSVPTIHGFTVKDGLESGGWVRSKGR